jgi:hypothetical protein
MPLRLADGKRKVANPDNIFHECTNNRFKQLLSELGLRLKTEKSKVPNAHEGFDFLSFHFMRRYQMRHGKQVTHFYPSRKAAETFRSKVRELTKKSIVHLRSVEQVIENLNLLYSARATVKRKIRVPVKDNTVELTYLTPDGSKLTRSATTNQDGAFTHELNVDVGGKWKVQAYWLGGEPYSEGIAPISRHMTFEVLSRQSMLNLVVFMIPILIVLIVAIVAIALLLLKRRGPSPVLRPRRPKRSWHIRRARTKQTP